MDRLLDEALAVWQECPPHAPRMDRTFSPAEQTVREAALSRFLESVQAELPRVPVTRTARAAVCERITTAFAQFARNGLQMEDRQVAMLMDGGFSSIGTSLAREARRFDPAVSVADIFQANRNAWTACGLQVLFGRAMRLTPSIFAYSMLYPYTDNYLDDPSIDAGVKRGFSSRFELRLRGEAIGPEAEQEAMLWRLVARIEEEYPRAEFPAVFESLLAIHRAQTRSVRLRRGEADSDTVLRVSFEKGGTSVQADGHLAAGRPDPEQERFAYFWGVFLQLADDLQDVTEDRRDGVLTLFSQAAGREPLDAVTSRTMQFGLHAMMLMHRLPGGGQAALKQVIQRSCFSLLIRAAGEAGSLHTQRYVEALEVYSPFRFSFLSTLRRRSAKNNGWMCRMFEAFLAGGEDEPAFPMLPGSLMPRM